MIFSCQLQIEPNKLINLVLPPKNFEHHLQNVILYFYLKVFNLSPLFLPFPFWLIKTYEILFCKILLTLLNFVIFYKFIPSKVFPSLIFLINILIQNFYISLLWLKFIISHFFNQYIASKNLHYFSMVKIDRFCHLHISFSIS